MLTHWVGPIAEWSAAALEIAGVAIIVITAAAATAGALVDALRKRVWQEIFRAYRLELSRGILLGLEFLVGADIIHTVAVDLSYESLGVLAVIVLLRTFLSFALEVEISGRWPWQRESRAGEKQ